jgi:hypothetical protein
MNKYIYVKETLAKRKEWIELLRMKYDIAE